MGVSEIKIKATTFLESTRIFYWSRPNFFDHARTFWSWCYFFRTLFKIGGFFIWVPQDQDQDFYARGDLFQDPKHFFFQDQDFSTSFLSLSRLHFLINPLFIKNPLKNLAATLTKTSTIKIAITLFIKNIKIKQPHHSSNYSITPLKLNISLLKRLESN